MRGVSSINSGFQKRCLSYSNGQIRVRHVPTSHIYHFSFCLLTAMTPKQREVQRFPPSLMSYSKKKGLLFENIHFYSKKTPISHQLSTSFRGSRGSIIFPWRGWVKHRVHFHSTQLFYCFTPTEGGKMVKSTKWTPFSIVSVGKFCPFLPWKNGGVDLNGVQILQPLPDPSLSPKEGLWHSKTQGSSRDAHDLHSWTFPKGGLWF